MILTLPDFRSGEFINKETHYAKRKKEKKT